MGMLNCSNGARRLYLGESDLGYNSVYIVAVKLYDATYDSWLGKPMCQEVTKFNIHAAIEVRVYSAHSAGFHNLSPLG